MKIHSDYMGGHPECCWRKDWPVTWELSKITCKRCMKRQIRTGVRWKTTAAYRKMLNWPSEWVLDGFEIGKVNQYTVDVKWINATLSPFGAIIGKSEFIKNYELV